MPATPPQLNAPLLLWLVLAGLFFLSVQWLGYLCRWRPAALETVPFLRPRPLMIVGTLALWLCSLVLLRLHTAEVWAINQPSLLILPVFLCYPVYLLGKKLALLMFKRKENSDLQRLAWTYCIVGLLLALAAPTLPVIILLANGLPGILSAVPTAMVFIACTGLPCVIGILAAVDTLSLRR